MRIAIAAILAVAFPASAIAAPVTVPSMTSQAFNASVGLNAHIDRTDGMHPNYAFTKLAFQSLRIHRLRTSLNILPGTNNNYTNFLQLLDDADKPDAIRTDQIVGPGLTSAQIVSKMQGLWGVDFFEGPNELDSTGSTWNVTDIAQMQQISVAQKNWSSIKTIAPSVASADPNLLVGINADYANMHPYTGTRMPETSGWGGDPYNTGGAYGSWTYNLGMARRAFGGTAKPVVVTEDGCTTDGGLLENTCGIYIPRMIVQCAAKGALCYTYDDFDDNEHYGLWDLQGRPKPAAYALQGLMVIASDPDGTAPVPCKDSAVMNSAVPLNALEICHANGEEDIAYSLAAEPQNPTTLAGQAITPAVVSLSVSNPGTVRLYKETPEGHYGLNSSPDMSNLIATERLSILTIRSAAVPVNIPLLPTV